MSEDHNQHQADHIPDTTEMIPYSVYIEDAHVCFSIGNQHFALGFEVDYELDYPVKYQLDWMKAQLDHALTALARQGWQSEEDWEAVAADQALTIAMMKQREWVGLTDEEIAEGAKQVWVNKQAFESAVWWADAKLKEKNTEVTGDK
jgi:hypothetical protein